MSINALLPCLVCGKDLQNAFAECDNQPSEGTEFRTYGHYGSTFWDSFDGEQLVINVCDECLNERRERLGQHKRYKPVTCEYLGMVGQYQVDRPIVPYTGHTDDGSIQVEPEELGTHIKGIEWADNIQELKDFAIGKRGDDHTG